jgi:LysM repeat protein
MLLSLLLVGPGMAQDTTAEPTAEVTEAAPVAETPAPVPTEIQFILYTVAPGDTLNRIATRFNTTIEILVADNNIANPNTVFLGSTLRIRPEGAPPPAPTATATAQPTVAPGATTTIVVAPGDTLNRIATRYNTTVAALLALNNLANPSLIFSGQTLIIPAEGSTVVTPAPTEEIAVTPEATAVPVMDAGFGYGINVYANPESAAQLAQSAVDLGVGWVRLEVPWRAYEATQGSIDFANMDATLQPFFDAGLDVMLMVNAAPDWARTSTDESGPPDNFQNYAAFIGQVAQRYAGRVNAYEVWSEPNLRREWNSSVHGISAESYIDLLQQAYVAIKAVDPAATVVSAGLAPTGFNDGVNAINDRLYLQALYANGLADVSDAIGAHPGGWANPPDSLCCEPAVGIETHYEDPSFYFLETINDYREIMVANGDGNTPLWITEFGWGTSEDTAPPSAIYVYVTYTSPAEQAIYTPRAFSLGSELGFVGPMFVNNLNGCQGLPGNAEACYYSLIGPTGAPRPVFNAILALDKTLEEPATETPATPEVTAFPDEPVATEAVQADPLALTATQIIIQATATAEAAVTPEPAAQG